jgi:GH15 family glucan-1,4-alpha-glucosidase
MAPENNREIADYGFIGDCRTAALISREGSVDWLCLPHFSAGSVFAGILDPSAGHFSIRPKAPFRATRRYLDHTPVLETIFETAEGTVRIADALVILDGLTPMKPMRELLRIVEGCAGEMELEIEIAPRPDYARKNARFRELNRIGWSFNWGNEALCIRSEIALDRIAASLHGRIRCTAGAKYRTSLSYVRGDPAIFPSLGDEADVRQEKTISWWRDWAGQFTYRGVHKEMVLRSALTLKQLTYSLSGALVAAPTTSLPEAIGQDLNWDYRYCWLRDAGLTVQALIGVGFLDDACAYLAWLLHATRLTWPELRVVYDIYGRQSLDEKELDQLDGFRGSRPVRIGNEAYRQLQLDVYGDVILAAEAVVSAGGKLDATETRMLKGLGKTVCRDWREPDSGMWEIRGPRRQYTFSKIMCWVALDRLLKLHAGGHLSLGSLEAQFRRERDRVVETIEQRGFNPALGSYTSELDGDKMVANLLLMSTLGYIAPTDPRFTGTFALIMQRLCRNDLLYRYEPGYDGAPRRESSFGICTFWAVEALASRGEIAAAERMFDRASSCANDLGLFGEEIDIETCAAIGNFPQAFTHVGLINAALAIERAKGGKAQC